MAGRGRGARRGCARGPGPRAGDGQKEARFAGEEGLADTPPRVALPIAVVFISAAIAAAKTVAEAGCHRRRRSAVHSSAPTTGQGRQLRRRFRLNHETARPRRPDRGGGRPPAGTSAPVMLIPGADPIAGREGQGKRRSAASSGPPLRRERRRPGRQRCDRRPNASTRDPRNLPPLAGPARPRRGRFCGGTALRALLLWSGVARPTGGLRRCLTAP